MFKHLKNLAAGNASTENRDDLVDAFIATQNSVNSLPALSPDEKVALEYEIAVGHLYHSSKIEGTNLNEERLQKAIDA